MKTSSPKYPGISIRITALFIDLFVVIVLLFLMTLLFSKMEGVSEEVKKVTFVFIFLLYDPLLTAFGGGTIGHHMNNLRIVKAADETSKISFFKALLRFAIKTLLGFISLMTIDSKSRSQAMHDLAVGSVVIFKNKLHSPPQQL